MQHGSVLAVGNSQAGRPVLPTLVVAARGETPDHGSTRRRTPTPAGFIANHDCRPPVIPVTIAPAARRYAGDHDWVGHQVGANKAQAGDGATLSMPLPHRTRFPSHSALSDETYEALVFDWDGTVVPDRQADARGARERIEALCDAGVHMFIVSGTHVENVDMQLKARPHGRGHLFCVVTEVPRSFW